MCALSERARAFSVEALLAQRNDYNSVPGENISPDIRVDTQADKSFIDYLKRNVKAELCCKELWRSFHKLGTEMIITKAGSSQWIVAGSGEPSGSVSGEPQVYVHPDSPATGQLWMAQGVIAFDKVKLTNNRRPLVKGQIYVHSMHKYIPRIHVLPVVDHTLPVLTKSCIDAAATFTYPETVFITVTAYQNQQITRLKIASNPFAKGFREPSRTRTFQDPTCQTASSQSVFSTNNGFVSAFHQMKPKRREMLETPLKYEVPSGPFSFPVKFLVHSQADDSSQSNTVETSNMH